jgi:hypothetical protein
MILYDAGAYVLMQKMHRDEMLTINMLASKVDEQDLL